MEAVETETLDTIVQNLELIHQVMPRDSAVMLTLYEAYKKAGHGNDAIDLLIVLARTVLAANECGSAQTILFLFSQVENARPELARLKEPLEQLAETATRDDLELASPLREKGYDLAPQITLLWNLQHSGEIERHEYVHLLERLGEAVASAPSEPISALRIMEQQEVGDAANALSVMSERTGMPLIDLAHFTVDDELLSRLPLEFWQRRGAFPFGVLEDQLMVAVMNPYDERLVTHIQKQVGGRCHFYTVHHDSYTDALLRAIDLWNQSAELGGESALSEEAV